MNDGQFVKAFSKLIAFLVALTIILIILGVVVGGSLDDKLRAQSEMYTQIVIANRTEPVGKLNVGEILEPMVAVESQQTVQVAAIAEDVGKSVYDKACYICHATGVTGAPKPGDATNWNPRIKKGIELLYANAINGFQGESGVMPPKGGNLLLSDDEVKSAVDYLVKLVE